MIFKEIYIILKKCLKSAWQINISYETVSTPYTTEACRGLHLWYTIIYFLSSLISTYMSFYYTFLHSIEVMLLNLNHLNLFCIAYRRGGVLRSTYMYTCGRSRYENIVMRRRFKSNNLLHHILFFLKGHKHEYLQSKSASTSNFFFQ